ncbi:MAG: hypothetical protein J5546_09550, partial [Lachnospiraceae bacterium]|nr:hypothetical protein [Lachnospiraceae bacterium]
LERQKEDYERQIEKLNAAIAGAQKKKSGAIIDTIKHALEQKIFFDTYDISEAIIDAFVDKIVVHKDKFEWYLNLFDKDDASVIYLKSGIRHNSCTPEGVVFSPQADCGTGSYR